MMCPCSHTSTHTDNIVLPSSCLWKPIGAEKVADACAELSFHSLVGQGTCHRHRRGSASYRHRNNESSSVSEIALLSFKRPKALPVRPSVQKTLTAASSTQREYSVRVCRQQIPPALGRARIRATAARSWWLNGRDTKLMSVHSLPHSKHTAFGSYCCLLWESRGLAQVRCVDKKQSFLMLKCAVYIVTAIAGNIWFVVQIMNYIILFSICGSGSNGSQHLG